jgi:hypothetical protein
MLEYKFFPNFTELFAFFNGEEPGNSVSRLERRAYKDPELAANIVRELLLTDGGFWADLVINVIDIKGFEHMDRWGENAGNLPLTR